MVLPRNAAYLYLVGPPPSQRFYLGQAEPAPYDDVADEFETLTFGDRLPQDLLSCRIKTSEREAGMVIERTRGVPSGDADRDEKDRAALRDVALQGL